MPPACLAEQSHREEEASVSAMLALACVRVALEASFDPPSRESTL